MKLISLILPENQPKRFRVQREIDLVNPVDSLIGYRVLVRGPSVILLRKDGGGHEFARSECVLGWDSNKPEDYEKISSYTSDVLAKPKA